MLSNLWALKAGETGGQKFKSFFKKTLDTGPCVKYNIIAELWGEVGSYHSQRLV